MRSSSGTSRIADLRDDGFLMGAADRARRGQALAISLFGTAGSGQVLHDRASRTTAGYMSARQPTGRGAAASYVVDRAARSSRLRAASPGRLATVGAFWTDGATAVRSLTDIAMRIVQS